MEQLSSPQDEPTEAQQMRSSGCSTSVLLIGEGNFSFAEAYRQLHPEHSIVATSYDSQDTVIEKYGYGMASRLNQLDQLGLIVLHGVDIHNLQACKALSKRTFDVIRFNFPLGNGAIDSENAKLVSSFFSHSKKYLKKDGKLVIATVDTSFYDEKFEYFEAARQNHFKLVKRSWWDKNEEYSSNGYNHRKTNVDRSPLGGYYALERTYRLVEGSDFDSQDEHSHSSGLSEDDGRINDNLNVPLKIGRGLAPTSYRKMRLEQLNKKYQDKIGKEKIYKTPIEFAVNKLNTLKESSLIGEPLYSDSLLKLGTEELNNIQLESSNSLYPVILLEEWVEIESKINFWANNNPNQIHDYLDSNLASTTLQAKSSNKPLYEALHKLKVLVRCFSITDDEKAAPTYCISLSIALFDLRTHVQKSSQFPDWLKEQLGVMHWYLDRCSENAPDWFAGTGSTLSNSNLLQARHQDRRTPRGYGVEIAKTYGITHFTRALYTLS